MSALVRLTGLALSALLCGAGQIVAPADEGWLEWSAETARARRGREYPALAGVEKRDYDFDVFWVGFPLKETASFLNEAPTAEIVVRVQSSEGRVRLTVPASIQTMANRPIEKHRAATPQD